MNEMVKVGGKLAIICAVAAIVLGSVNAVTSPIIIENKRRALQEALSSLVPEGIPGSEVLIDEDQALRGYYEIDGAPEGGADIIVRLVGIGYGGDMELLAAYRPDGSIAAVVLMDNQETPGLGKEAERTDYMEKFLNKGGDSIVPTSKNHLERIDADAITGATITFLGIGKALETGSFFVKSEQKQSGGAQ